MSELVNVVVAFAVIVFIVRWMASGSSATERSAADTLGFRPKNVTPEMVNTISTMFPDIPADNIRYDLMRTGNVEMTTNKILERGYLDAPPQAYWTLHPRPNNGSTTQRPANSTTTSATSSSSGSSSSQQSKPKDSLITKYNLQERITTAETIPEDSVGGKAAWEASPEKREASLRERKAQMILAARQ
ncbi:hypothetical protein M378DRAFT_80723 [Amanita muscaria Koide BX008]|uniref:CUE domain-containing protein n=1 Tax=Amanita muscaria (strain Koide BX008) TaxID=946122 RepID=A0A0C2SEZ6_AMAMK|nr:hypothetical protein M378DRAFT_82403 [Amanita muscaria Koide BX008]KIL62846.1 hypothetical protein M378DRAFT_80723 [Amanita muscaria Koide BX008]